MISAAIRRWTSLMVTGIRSDSAVSCSVAGRVWSSWGCQHHAGRRAHCAQARQDGLTLVGGGKPAQVARPAHDPPVVAERPDWITGVVRGPNCVDDQWSVGQPVEVDVAEDGVEWSIVSDGQ